MKKNISISIDEETYKTFRIALDFSGQTEEEALMQSIHSYIAKVLGKVVNNFQAKSLQKCGEGNYTQKAKNRCRKRNVFKYVCFKCRNRR